MLTVSFTVANKMTGDLNHRELMEAVIEMTVEMVSDPNEFDEFDDGIYFVKYNSEGIEMGGMSPRGFDLTLGYKENTVRTYEKNGEKYYLCLKYATDTDIRRFTKIQAKANPFDEDWQAYFDKREETTLAL